MDKKQMLHKLKIAIYYIKEHNKRVKTSDTILLDTSVDILERIEEALEKELKE